MEFGHSLGKIIENTSRIKQVRKSDLQFGDLVLIATKNSIYYIYVIDNDFYLVFGGWFDRKGLSPIKTTISGCTWGGRMINADTLAACGLYLEFGNRVVTSTIQKICLIRSGCNN